MMRTGSPGEHASPAVRLPSSPRSSDELTAALPPRTSCHEAQHLQTAVTASILKENPSTSRPLFPGPNAPALHQPCPRVQVLWTLPSAHPRPTHCTSADPLHPSWTRAVLSPRSPAILLPSTSPGCPPCNHQRAPTSTRASLSHCTAHSPQSHQGSPRSTPVSCPTFAPSPPGKSPNPSVHSTRSPV